MVREQSFKSRPGHPNFSEENDEGLTDLRHKGNEGSDEKSPIWDDLYTSPRPCEPSGIEIELRS